MNVIIDKQPIKHNYYNFDDMFRFDMPTGIAQTRNGQRIMQVSEDFIVGLQAGLEQEVGDASAVIMYKIGLSWARADMRRFETEMVREFGGDVQEMSLQFVMEQWWWPLQVMGWGSWSLDLEGKREQGLIVVDLWDSVVAKSLGEIGKPVCYVYAGLFAGVISYLARRELSGIEIQCYAMGADFCRFLVGSSKRINAVEFWLEEGASASDIMKRV